MKDAIRAALAVAAVPAPLVKVREDTPKCRATGLPVYTIFVKARGASRGRRLGEFLWLEA